MGTNLDAIINKHFKDLHEIDLHILSFVENNLQVCSDLNITELSTHCNVSTASIMRTTRKLQFDGYSDFKYFLRREIANKTESIEKNHKTELHDDIQQTIQVFEQNNTKQEIYTLLDSSDTIYAYGTGYGQRLMIKEFARCMLNENKNIILLPASTELKIAKQNFKITDVLLLVSLSGNIDKYKETLHNLGVRGIPMVSITNLNNNELSSFTQYNFYFQNTDIDYDIKLNRSSFLTLHLLLHLIYEGYKAYLEHKNHSEIKSME